MMRSELAMLKELNHPNLVRVFELCEDKNYIYEVSELVQQGDLFNVIGRICETKKSVSELQVAKWVVQILESLNYLHTKGVMHRDLKLENVMIDIQNIHQHRESICKITDFGFARTITKGRLESEEIGTPTYMAPEMIRGEYHDNRVDVWALGILTSELLFGHEPFYGE